MKNPFKPATSSSSDLPADAAGRIAALRALPENDAATDATLERVARDDDDASVRRAAIGRIADAARLLELYREPAIVEPLGDVLTQRLAELLEADAVPDDLAASWFEQDSARLAPLIAARGPGGDLRRRALDAVTQQSDLAEIAGDSRYHDTRLAAAERLQDETLMRALLPIARNRDKVVARQLQQRLDDAAQAVAEREQAESERLATLHAIEQLASSVWSPQHAGRREVLMTRWRELPGEPGAAAQARVDGADAAVQAMLDTHRDSENASDAAGAESETERESESETGAAPGTGSDAATQARAAGTTAPNGASATSGDGVDATGEATDGQVGESLPAAPAEPSPPPVELDPVSLVLLGRFADQPLEALAAIEPAPETGSEQASALDAHRRAVGVLFDPPFALAGARPAAVQQRLERVGALLDLDRVLPGIDAGRVPWIAPLAEHRDALATRLEQSRQESADRQKATVRQFGALSGLVKEGKWAPATSLFRRIEKKVGAMEDAERRPLNDRLERARKQLAEMADWQDFASKPKLEEVVVRMEALAAPPEGGREDGNEVDPAARAKRVRELQAEWKSLGASRAANELWPRFKTAADAAYAPCKAWFDERDRERDAKRQERVAIVEELEGAVAETRPGEDGTPPDSRALQSRVSRARQGWSRTRVNDRKPDRSLEGRFTAALKPFETVLLDEYKANEAEKQALVERMTELASADIDQHAANRAKSLQAAWKAVGPTRRKQDQTLWEAFNEQARTVFAARRDASREQQKAELAHVYRGRAIVDELKKLARQQPVDDARIQSLQGEFDALPDFPERDRKGLTRAFREALDGVSRQRETSARRRADAARDEVRRLVALCERAERAVEAAEAGRDSGENPLSLREEIVDSWANGGGEASAPREVAQALEQRRDAALAHLAAGTAPDWAAGEEARRELLIRMEVAADIESPSEDRSRRMAFQLANLQEGMTSAGVTDRRTRLADLEREWLVAPPAPPTVGAALESRFLKAMGR